MTTEIALVLAVLAATIVLFVSDRIRVDLVALLALLAVGWLGLVTPEEALAGFSSGAVISIIGVMILAYGLERSGVTSRLARPLLALAGRSERRVLGIVMVAVGAVSAFMQNVGAAALFLPVLLRAARERRIPASRLLMPVGFATILGGTLTLVASGPLIVLNDLLRQGGERPFGLFSVTPIGALLLAGGVAYFLVAGRRVLPDRAPAEVADDPQRRLCEAWRIAATVHGCAIDDGSPLVGKTVEEARLWQDYALNLVALREGGDVQDAPWRQTRFAAGQDLALLGRQEDFERFVADQALLRSESAAQWSAALADGRTHGFAEFVVRPRAAVVGRTLRMLALRRHHRVEPLILLSGDGEETRDFSDVPLRPGSTLLLYGAWDRHRELGRDPSFLLVTPIEAESVQVGKGTLALLVFVASIGLALSGLPLPMCLLSGAVAMVLLGIVPLDAAYCAVDWRTVFLMAGLIPLGTAMEKTGAAALLARGLGGAVAGGSPLLVLLAVAILTTLFSLFLSNVAATVLLVPLALVIGRETGLDPRALALLVAVAASNSFALPTHQVNALFMAPGGYRGRDYLVAGGVMTVIFLVIAVGATFRLSLGPLG